MCSIDRYCCGLFETAAIARASQSLLRITMDQARRFRGPPLYSVLWTVPAGLLSKLGFQFFMFAIELRAPGARSCILFELPALPIGLALSIIPYWALCDLTDLAAISTRPKLSFAGSTERGRIGPFWAATCRATMNPPT